MKIRGSTHVLLWSGVIVAGIIGWTIFGARLGLPGATVGADALRLWTRPYFHIGGLAVSPSFLTKFLVYLVLLTIASRMIRRFLRNEVLVHTTLDRGQRYAVEQAAGYLVAVFGLLIGLEFAGIDLRNLAVLGGALGIGIGFGLQNIANNFVSGLILLLERPIRVGDRIEIGSLNGDVVRIGGRSTWIRTNDNIVIIVPNSDLISNRVTNWTANDRQVRVSLPVGVSYRSDPQRVREILLAAAASHPEVLRNPPPEVLFVGFGDSSLDFKLRVWTMTRVQTPQILQSDLYFTIFQAFQENDIEIPYPQRDLHVRSVALPIPITSDRDRANQSRTAPSAAARAE